MGTKNSKVKDVVKPSDKLTSDFQCWDGSETGKELKIILLGSGECGKSTFFRQLQKILSQFNEHEKKTFIPCIYENIWRMSKDCILSCQKRYPKSPFSNEKTRIFAENLVNFDKDYNDFKESYGYTPEIYQSVMGLWEDEHIREVFRKYRGIDFHVNDGCDFLFQKENLARYKAPPLFIPTFEDLIQCRKKTSGINKLKFKVKAKEFIICDVGGQRSERKKWAITFENTSLLIFVSSLGDWDQKCYEDDLTNRMVESMDLYEKTVNNSFFLDKKIILLLNKKDVLIEKLEKKDLSEVFDDYKGGNNYENALNYIIDKFKEKTKGSLDRLIVKISQATNPEVVKDVFEDIKAILDVNFK